MDCAMTTWLGIRQSIVLFHGKSQVDALPISADDIWTRSVLDQYSYCTISTAFSGSFSQKPLLYHNRILLDTRALFLVDISSLVHRGSFDSWYTRYQSFEAWTNIGSYLRFFSDKKDANASPAHINQSMTISQFWYSTLSGNALHTQHHFLYIKPLST